MAYTIIASQIQLLSTVYKHVWCPDRSVTTTILLTQNWHRRHFTEANLVSSSRSFTITWDRTLINYFIIYLYLDVKNYKNSFYYLPIQSTPGIYVDNANVYQFNHMNISIPMSISLVLSSVMCIFLFVNFYLTTFESFSI